MLNQLAWLALIMRENTQKMLGGCNRTPREYYVEKQKKNARASGAMMMVLRHMNTTRGCLSENIIYQQVVILVCR